VTKFLKIEIHVKYFYFYIFYFSDLCIDFSRIAASTPQMMTSLIRSYVEYLVQTYHIIVIIL